VLLDKEYQLVRGGGDSGGVWRVMLIETLLNACSLGRFLIATKIMLGKWGLKVRGNVSGLLLQPQPHSMRQ